MLAIDAQAPLKMKSVHAHYGPFVTKDLCMTIMLLSKWRENYNRTRKEVNYSLYKKQRNKCISLLLKAEVDYYRTLNTKDVTDNRKLWSTMKPIRSIQFKQYECQYNFQAI